MFALNTWVFIFVPFLYSNIKCGIIWCCKYKFISESKNIAFLSFVKQEVLQLNFVLQFGFSKTMSKHVSLWTKHIFYTNVPLTLINLTFLVHSETEFASFFLAYFMTKILILKGTNNKLFYCLVTFRN